MNNKLAIAIVAVMVAALAAPAVMAADVVYSASVGSAANVVVDFSNSSFGSVSAGSTYTIDPSITLTNSGNAIGTVDAEFTTNLSATEHGMVSGSSVILAEHLTIDEEPLNNDGTPDTLSQVPAHSGGTDGTVSYVAELYVPVGQAPVSYTGNVQLTFGTV